MSHHICFLVTRGDSIGGAQIHVRDMAISLKGEGWKVTVLTGTAGDMTEQLSEAEVSWEVIPQLVRPISPKKDLAAIFALRAILKRLKPDLLSCHTAKSGMVGRAAAFLAGIPSLFTAHGWQFADSIPQKQAAAVQFIEKLTSPFCRRVITVSHYDHNLAIRKRAVRKSKLVTIHNGLPWRDRFIKAVDDSENQGGPCRLLMVARFQEQKDHAALLEALAGLRDLNWTLDLVGDGPDLEREINRAETLGIGDRVAFPGQCLDVPERMEQAEIYLLISHWEGFPRSIVEAMRAGLPVIASDVGGNRESVADGETGFIIPRSDVPALRERLSRLISDPALCRRMGEAGRKRYEAEFTFQRMYERTVALYKEIL